jgi:predicted RNA-binding protein with PIN domain
MHILVDGYNLIRQSIRLRSAERQGLEEGRNALLHLLEAYRSQKGHHITSVFDGWEGGSPNEERDRYGGIDIIYSPLGRKADDVIKGLLERRAEEFVVVSSDRDIVLFAKRRGHSAISSLDFEQKLRELPSSTLLNNSEKPEPAEEDEDEPSNRIGTKKKGPARKLSRVQRREKQTLKKL